jgi:hypothetical protein
MFPDIATASSNQPPSLFMFVWSPITNRSDGTTSQKRKEDFEVSFRYWLRFLASKSRKSNIALKVIVVLTHADRLRLIKAAVSTELQSVRNDFKEIIDILVDDTFEVDARNMDSVKGVGEYTFDIAKQLLQGAQIYDICSQVSEYLPKQRQIITWSTFRKICREKLYIPGDDPEPKLHAVALSLNESGDIIYVNNIKHIILDPNWFCRDILGSLIYFPEGNQSFKTMVIQGFTTRVFLEQKLKLVTNNSGIEGSLLVDLMEGMHLCCNVPASSVTGIMKIVIMKCLSQRH